MGEKEIVTYAYVNEMEINRVSEGVRERVRLRERGEPETVSQRLRLDSRNACGE